MFRTVGFSGLMIHVHKKFKKSFCYNWGDVRQLQKPLYFRTSIVEKSLFGAAENPFKLAVFFYLWCFMVHYTQTIWTKSGI